MGKVVLNRWIMEIISLIDQVYNQWLVLSLTSQSLSLCCLSGLARMSLDIHRTHELQRCLLKCSIKSHGNFYKNIVTLCSPACFKLMTVLCLICREHFYRRVDTVTDLTDGRWVKFFLGFPQLQRQNCLDLKQLQTLFGCLWLETATTWKRYRCMEERCNKR